MKRWKCSCLKDDDEDDDETLDVPCIVLENRHETLPVLSMIGTIWAMGTRHIARSLVPWTHCQHCRRLMPGYQLEIPEITLCKECLIDRNANNARFLVESLGGNWECWVDQKAPEQGHKARCSLLERFQKLQAPSKMRFLPMVGQRLQRLQDYRLE